MSQLFSCSLCNTQLESANSNSSFQKCDVCGNQIIVPPEARTPSPNKAVSSGILDQGRKIMTIQREISAGRKANAIKIFRETYNCDALTANEAIDAIERNDQAMVTEMVLNLNNFAKDEELETDKFTLGGLVLWLIISVAVVAFVSYVIITLTR
ncbi:MAG: hypothetical protein ABI954_12755 [Pyrinomonadaceae bacterium]